MLILLTENVSSAISPNTLNRQISAYFNQYLVTLLKIIENFYLPVQTGWFDIKKLSLYGPLNLT